MSFSTLLGTFKQRKKLSDNQDDWTDDDFQGINLLESTRDPANRIHERNTLLAHSRMFASIERTSAVSSKIEIRTEPMLATIEENVAESPEVVVKPPLHHHKTIPPEPQKRDPSLVY